MTCIQQIQVHKTAQKVAKQLSIELEAKHKTYHAVIVAAQARIIRVGANRDRLDVRAPVHKVDTTLKTHVQALIM
jgi:hypothetical protein